MKMWISVWIICLFRPLFAQETGTLSIISTPEKCWVRINAATVGQTPLTSMVLTSGPHLIQIFPPASSLWNLTEKRYIVNIKPQRDTTINVIFSPPLLINSIPYGAQLFLKDSLLGKTPLYIPFERYRNQLFQLKKTGFKTYPFYVRENKSLLARLTSEAKVSPTLPPTPRFLGIFPKNRLKRKFTLLAISAVSHWISFYFKNVSDQHFSDYRQTGDAIQREHYWQQTQKYDRLSEVSLGASYVSLAGLIYLIVKD